MGEKGKVHASGVLTLKLGGGGLNQTKIYMLREEAGLNLLI